MLDKTDIGQNTELRHRNFDKKFGRWTKYSEHIQNMDSRNPEIGHKKRNMDSRTRKLDIKKGTWTVESGNWT